MFEELYAEIPARLIAKNPQNGFNIEDLFTGDEWLLIGDGAARQKFGSRFASAVRNGQFVGVSRNAQPNEKGGNEARYNYDPNIGMV